MLAALRRIAAVALTAVNRKLRNVIENLRMTQGIAIGYSNGHTTFDELRVLPDGSIWIAGWSTGETPDAATVLRGGERCALVSSYRTYRPDVAVALGGGDGFRGFEAVYAAPSAPTDASLELRVGDASVHKSRVGPNLGAPHYAMLLDSERILVRDEIYGSGPPVAAALAEVLDLASTLRGDVLDFGCGAGFLVDYMRSKSIAAQGIEIDRPAIRQHLIQRIAPHVRLYDGSLPLPFNDESFDGIISTEVLEHIPSYGDIVPELARITCDTLILTVPDAEAIPRLFHANVVPWHLLESTHFNFFTEHSLRALLEPHFGDVRMLKIGLNRTNGIPWCTSLVAVCRKRPALIR